MYPDLKQGQFVINKGEPFSEASAKDGLSLKPFTPKDGQVAKNIETMFQVELSQVYS